MQIVYKTERTKSPPVEQSDTSQLSITWNARSH